MFCCLFLLVLCRGVIPCARFIYMCAVVSVCRMVSLCRGVCRSACGCGLVAAGMCCLSVSLCRGVGRMVRHSSSGEPVGWSACRMVCLWLSVPSVLGVGCAACACGLVAVVCVGRMVCHSSSGEPVGWSACRIGCLWSIPSTYCQPVSLCRGLCRSVGWSATVPAVRVWDVLPV